MEAGIVHYLEIKHIFISNAAIFHKVKKTQILLRKYEQKVC